MEDLRRTRRELDLTVEELADRSGISAPLLRKWERTGEVPRSDRKDLEWAVWEIRRDRALDESGLPECDWLQDHVDRDSEPDPELIADHMDECDLCAERAAFVEEHVGPPPTGLLARAVSRVAARVVELPAWIRSAVAGASVLFLWKGIAIVILLGAGLYWGNLQYVLGGLAALGVLALAGGAGGVAHHLTRPLRARGTAGYYASWIVTAYGGVAAVMALGALAIALAGGEAVDEDIHFLVAEPTGWALSMAVGALLGLGLGVVMRPED